MNKFSKKELTAITNLMLRYIMNLLIHTNFEILRWDDSSLIYASASNLFEKVGSIC